jgi:hypothetical protein
MASTPWPLDEIGGIQVGGKLDELTIRRFGLRRQPDEHGCQWWSDWDDDVSVVVYEGLIGLLSRRDVAVVNGRDLIGLDPLHLSEAIGLPDRLASVTEDWVYESPPWRF